MSKSPKNYRKNHIMLRLTDDEYQTVKMRAENAQIALAVYARNCVLNRKMTIKKQREISGKYLNQIAWIGNNINQLAKVINVANIQDETDIKTLLDVLEINLKLAEIQDDLSDLKNLVKKDSDECW